MTDFDAIFKAYDVRGTVPDQFTADGAKAIGGAFARFVAGQGETSMVVGHDMRPEGEEFSRPSVTACSSTASTSSTSGCAQPTCCTARGCAGHAGRRLHRIAQPADNGIKMCLGSAIAGDTGLDAIKAMAIAGPDPSGRTGARTEQHMLPGYVDHVRSFVDVSSLRPLKVVADTANGMGGLVVPALMASLPSRPHVRTRRHLSEPSRRSDPAGEPRDLMERVLATNADIGLRSMATTGCFWSTRPPGRSPAHSPRRW